MVLKRVGGVLLAYIFLFGSVFGQNTTSTQVCSTTPVTVQSYVDFVTQAIAILGDEYKDGMGSPLGPFSSQFVSGNLSLKNSHTLATIYKAHQERLKESLLFLNNTKKVLVKNVAGALDAWSRQQVSLYTPVLKRDLDKIAQLDPVLDNVSLALGRAGLSSRTLDSQTQDELMQLIGSYSPHLLQTDSTVVGASYDTVIKLLNRMQSQMKQAIILNHSNQVINNERLIIASSSSSLAISQEAQNALVDDYQAVREQSCNESVQKTQDAFGDARQNGVKGVGDATQEFVRGWKTLTYFFAGGSTTLNTQDENMIKSRIEELERSRRGYKGESGMLTHFPTPMYRNNFKDLLWKREKKKDQAQVVKDVTDQNDTSKPVSVSNMFGDRLEDAIIQLHDTTVADNLILVASQSQDHTQTVADTAVVINRLDQVLKGIEDNLATTCDLQCTNKGGVCRSK